MNPNHKRILVACYFILILFWAVIIVLIGSISLPYNPTSFRFVNKQVANEIRSLLPEGFSFFTRDPREPMVLLYQETGEKKIVRLTEPNNNSSDLGGLIRKNRALNLELGSLLYSIKNKPWRRFKEEPIEQAILTDSIPFYELEGEKNFPLLCGVFYIQSIEKVPWAWAGSFPEDKMPFHLVKVKVNCTSTHAE